MSVLDQQYTMITKFPLTEDTQVARDDGTKVSDLTMVRHVLEDTCDSCMYNSS
jgi:hypothetical protein